MRPVGRRAPPGGWNETARHTAGGSTGSPRVVSSEARPLTGTRGSWLVVRAIGVSTVMRQNIRCSILFDLLVADGK